MTELSDLAQSAPSALVPWEHQERAYNFARVRRGSLLAVAMGGGKTFVALNLLKTWEARRVLVVCPKSVIPVWPSQVAKHRPEFKCYPLTKGSVRDKHEVFANVFNNVRVPFITVVNYESVWRGVLGRSIQYANLDAIILDEIHRIKAPGSKVSWFMRAVGPYVEKKLGLSGTPLPNSPTDIYAQGRFLEPKVFGTSNTRFKAMFTIPGGYQGRQVIGFRNQELFREKYNSFVVTVTAEELDFSLPPTLHRTISVELPKKVMKAYGELEEHFVAKVRSGEIVAGNALVSMLRLSQMANGHATVEQEDESTIIEELHTEKQEALTDVLLDLDHNEPVVVFCRFKHDLVQIHKAADAAKRLHYELSGSRNQLDDWNNATQGAVLAVQIQAGAEGVDFTLARYCVYYSLDFSLGRYEQSLARVHRPGQKRSVIYTHIVAKGTIDHKLYSALSSKRKVIDSILSDLTGGEELEDLPL